MTDQEFIEPTLEELGMSPTSTWERATPQNVVDHLHGKDTPEAKRRMRQHEEFMKRWYLK